MAFPGAEWWCPHCGASGGFFGTGELVGVTGELKTRAEQDKENAREYLHAMACLSASRVRIDDGEGGDKWVTPDELPAEHKARNDAAIAAWQYAGRPK